jgi:hypothetical protein
MKGLQFPTGTVWMPQRLGIGCLTSAIVYVKRVAASGLQVQLTSGDLHD